MSNKIYIVIPVFNRCEETLKCLASLCQQTYDNFLTIVVDDGSSDDTELRVKEAFPEVILLKGDGNLWWTGGTNKGVVWALERAQRDDLILTLNNDLTVGTDYLQTLMAAFKESGPNIVLGSKSVFSNDASKVMFAGVKINWLTGTSKPSTERLEKQNCLIKTTVLPGRGSLFPVAVFNKIGLYDAENFPQYLADYDFSLRAEKAGYPLYVVEKAVVHSDVEKTGLGSQYNYKQTSFTDIIKSFWSIRSSKHLGKRWRYSIRHCPRLYLLPNLILDTLIVTTSYWRKRYLD